MKNDTLKLYRINIDYIKYLYSFDNRVQFNPNREEEYSARRPYLGIVLTINEFDYFVPLEHPRISHQKLKNNVFIFKIHSGKYGILGFNNMIPVPKEQIENFNINQEEDSYKQILLSQYRFCNKHIKEIKSKAEITYLKYQTIPFLKKVCCDFKLLEEKCKIYNL